MALPTSGTLSINQIHIEAGGTSGTACSINDSDIRGLTPASGYTISTTSGTAIDFGDFFGASGVQTYTITTEGTYSGYVGYDTAGGITFGALNSYSYTDNGGSSRTIIRIIYGSNGLYFNLSPSGGGSSSFSKLTINCGGTNYDFTRTRAAESNYSTRSEWIWNTSSVLTSAEQTALGNQLDGTGTTVFQIHN